MRPIIWWAELKFLDWDGVSNGTRSKLECIGAHLVVLRSDLDRNSKSSNDEDKPHGLNRGMP